MIGRLDLEKLLLLETLNVTKRLETINAKLVNELNIAQAEKRIQSRVDRELEVALAKTIVESESNLSYNQKREVRSGKDRWQPISGSRG